MEEHWDTHPPQRAHTRSVAPVTSFFSEPRHVKQLSSVERALERFSPGERAALYMLTAILALCTLFMLARIDAAASEALPASGGTLVEGETGPLRFINPLLAVSQPDQDLTALVYSGLVRALPDGTVVPDLAQSYSISDDGRTYTFKLRPGASFSDGTKVTADDVLFTVALAQDQDLNSSRRADWTGVTVASPDPQTVVFTLPHAYAPFIENATLGILPKHLWSGVSIEEIPFSSLNTHPVGSGPYKIAKTTLDSTGAASSYELVPFGGYALGTPYLSHITFRFYASEDDLVKALNGKAIDAAAGISADALSSVKRSDLSVVEVPLPRSYGVFYDQSHNPVLADSAVRAALDAATDRQTIIAQELGSRAALLNGPIPPNLLSSASPSLARPIRSLPQVSTSTPDETTRIAEARAILEKGGWKYDDATSAWTKGKQTLSFTLSTADQPELTSTARALAAEWQAAGMNVSVQIYPLAQLNTDVLRPRNYDALLFGEIVGPELDLYAFWHSSQRSDPGLNLALYTNAKADALLTQARATTDAASREALYSQFADLIAADRPALFLFAPDFLYVVPNDIHGIELGALSGPSDRFAGVYSWYTETKNVWKVFIPKDRSIQ